MLSRPAPEMHYRQTQIRIRGLGPHTSYGMPKFEINLPNYLVAKRQKGTRKNRGEAYVLYYWQPRRDLRASGFRSVPLGRDLTKAIAGAKTLNDRLAAWRRSRSRLAEKGPWNDTAPDRYLSRFGGLSREGTKNPDRL
jgi:hypothetical protein